MVYVESGRNGHQHAGMSTLVFAKPAISPVVSMMIGRKSILLHPGRRDVLSIIEGGDGIRICDDGERKKVDDTSRRGQITTMRAPGHHEHIPASKIDKAQCARPFRSGGPLEKDILLLCTYYVVGCVQASMTPLKQHCPLNLPDSVS